MAWTQIPRACRHDQAPSLICDIAAARAQRASHRSSDLGEPVASASKAGPRLYARRRRKQDARRPRGAGWTMRDHDGDLAGEPLPAGHRWSGCTLNLLTSGRHRGLLLPEPASATMYNGESVSGPAGKLATPAYAADGGDRDEPLAEIVMERLHTRFLITALSAAVSLIAAGCDREPPAPSASIPTIPAGAVDDTFACLAEPGPLIEIRGDQEYKAYKNRSFADNTRFDADGRSGIRSRFPNTRPPILLTLEGERMVVGQAVKCWEPATKILVGENSMQDLRIVRARSIERTAQE